MHFIGIDLGGTKIAAGVTDQDGTIIAQAQEETGAGRPYPEVVRDMAHCAREAMRRAGVSEDGVAAIGVGIPGIADNAAGRVIFCTNLGWRDVPLRDEMRKYIDKPLFMDNDATVAGFAESVAGVSRGASSSVFLTLGTGVGGGIVIGGKPWTGAHGVATELGHLTLKMGGEPCTCGNRGCLERYCSATALIRMAREEAERRPDALYLRRAGGNPDDITGRLVIDAAREGDPAAVRVFDEYTESLACAVNTVISFLDPEVIVLGGGISLAGSFLLDAVRGKLPKYLMFKSMPYSRVELAVLGNDAGIIGAAMLGMVMHHPTQALGVKGDSL